MTSLLICSIGPYALRQRPLAIGLPLEGAVAVRPMGPLMPFPGRTPGLLGLTMHEGQIVPVYALAELLDLDSASLAGDPVRDPGPGGASRDPATEGVVAASPAGSLPPYLVIVRLGSRLLGLAVDSAGGTERPLHVAPADLLAPLVSSAVVGALPSAQRWVAVVDPSRLALHEPIAA